MPSLARSLLASLLLALAAPAAAADARRGEALYVGSTALAAGGAPCLACHGIAGHGLARAASFGPDLSTAHAQFGADGLDAMLEDIVFPSMEPVYRGHAVTPEERSDLVAFLGEATGGAPPRLGVGFAARVLGAMAVFLVAVVLLGRRGRLRGPRAPAGEGRTP